jgi:hypothetical protein
MPPLELNGSTGVSLVQDGVVTAADLASTLDLTGKTVTLPAGVGGKVLQVVSATKTDTFSTTSTSYTNVTGLTISITPTSATSKILLLATVCGSVSNVNAAGIGFRFNGGNATSYIADSAGSRIQTAVGMKNESTNFSYYFVPFPFNMNYLDNPATTSAITYAVQIRLYGQSATLFVNRSGEDSDNVFHPRTASTITVMEIAA